MQKKRNETRGEEDQDWNIIQIVIIIVIEYYH